jgi:O-antigen/teichoic acid export membrane protein
MGAPLFFSVFVISIKDKFNVILLEFFLNEWVTIYDFVIKIMTVLIQPIEIINNTVYPKIAKEKKYEFMKKITKYTLFIDFISYLLSGFLSFVIDFVNCQ